MSGKLSVKNHDVCRNIHTSNERKYRHFSSSKSEIKGEVRDKMHSVLCRPGSHNSISFNMMQAASHH